MYVLFINESSLPEDLEQTLWLAHSALFLHNKVVGKFYNFESGNSLQFMFGEVPSDLISILLTNFVN